MAALAFFAYFLLGIGPGIVFFVFIIAPKSFLVLLSFTSTFLWLLVLLLTSAIFRGFVPLQYTTGSYAGLLIGAVAIQEICRYLLWRIHAITIRVLDKHARAVGHRFDTIDKLYLALGWGYGHGAAHVIFFVLSFLPLTTGDGTWYYEQCPSMSIFLAGALYALAFGMLLPSLMVIAFEGYQEKHPAHIAYAPLMHLTASLLTLINFHHNGCQAAFPILLALGAANVAYAGMVCWRKGPHQSPAGTAQNLADGSQEGGGSASRAQLADRVSPSGNSTQTSNQPARRRGPRPGAGSNWPLMPNSNE